MVLDEIELAETHDDKRLVLKKFSLKAFLAGIDSKVGKKTIRSVVHRMLNMLKP